MSILPTKILLSEIRARHEIRRVEQVDLRLREIGQLMIAASKHCIRFIRLPRDEPLIHEYQTALENDGYYVNREYIRVDIWTIEGQLPDDEFVGWIISW